ncbi:murein hydrolase activator EnvC family protein [Leucobacter chromiiresistens]|uniref:Peptidase family M23 n=1 Tax=Leucobacter chromiiresistens TaxID=1079994 RepID=A0A1H1AAE4_9MICO|nr:M23 family metallopeptidase [Leucobacter chromiiresistens]SDQ36589.1 Peptidase family M23 [Leucobacter chromiiresistens]
MRHRRLPGALVRVTLCALALWAPLALPTTPAPSPAPSATTPAIRADGSRWLPPLEATPFELIEAFRAPPHEYGPGHRGIDLAAPPGATVRAPAAGTVSFAGLVVDRPVVSVQVDEQTVYSMEPVTSDLQQGDAVGIGSPIGAVAAGGHCDARCLHLGIRVDDAYVNPMRYFVARPVLLPW